MMFITLLSKEVREHLLTFRFGAALITIVMLSIISVWILGDNYVIRNNTAIRLADTYAQQAREVRFPSHILPNVQRFQTPLSIFAQGEDNHLGNTVNVRRRWIASEAADNLTKNKLLASLPTFDMLLIFMFSISLFGILLSYDAFSGEKERGTLKLLCSFTVKRGTLFTVKFLAGVIVLSIPIILSFISALLILLFVHNITFTALHWFSIGLMLAAGLLYGALFIAVGFVSSVFANRSSTSLAIALLFWTLGVIIIPSVGNFLAPMFKPVLPPEEVSRLVKDSALELSDKRVEFIESNNLDLSSNGGDWEGAERIWWFDGYPSWLRDWVKIFKFYEALAQQRAERIWDVVNRHLARKREQLEVSNSLNFISPAFHLRRSLTALAATDYGNHADFMEQCRRYRRMILDTFQQKGLFGENAHRFFTRWEWSDMQRPEQYEERLADRRAKGIWGPQIWEPLPVDYAPAFNYESGRPQIDAGLWHIAVLAIMTAIAFCLGFVVFIRYDVR